MFCPNFSNKQVKSEFNSLKDKVGEDTAYYLWDKHEGDFDKILKDPLLASNEPAQQQVLQKTTVSSVNERPKSFTAQQWSDSNRLADLLQELYPELSLNYVESLREGLLGQADLDALKVLIDYHNQKIDTLPHEYAHYYIAMFRDSDIVKEALLHYDNEEALVLAIGEQVVKQDGKVRSWWKKFTDWVLKVFGKSDAKQALLNELTDHFLKRDAIGVIQQVYGKYNQESKTKPAATLQDLRTVLAAGLTGISFNSQSHTYYYTDPKTGQQKQLTPTTTLKLKYGFDSYDKSNEDLLLQSITERSAQLGTNIHGVFEALWFDKFDKKNFPGFTDNAIKNIRSIVDNLKSTYEIVGSEVLLADVKAGVAGTADVIFRDKKTGEIVLGDFKTKMVKNEGSDVNEKGKKLHGFYYVTSTRFSPKSTRDAYDFQLSVYQHMINSLISPLGAKVTKRVIIPICYGYTKKSGITFANVSKMFGTDEKTNELLVKDGYVIIQQKISTKNVVNHKLFNDEYSKEEVEQKETAENLSSLVDKITKKLRAQNEILSKRMRTASIAKEAAKILEVIQNIDEIDAILNYVKFADDTLSRLTKQIDLRTKKGNSANWSLETLTDYKNISLSYVSVLKIPLILQQYGDSIDAETIKQINKFCYSASYKINKTLSAYDEIGKKLYLDMITPYTSNVKYQMVQRQRQEYKKKNPRKEGESLDDFELRIKQYTDKWEKKHQEEIQHATRVWLEGQSEIADAGFECNGIAAVLGSVYETTDPFVSSIVKMFDKRMNGVQEQMIKYRANVARILKEFRKKYGNTNFSNFSQVFGDLVDVIDGKSYLINKNGSEYIVAERKVYEEIYKDSELTLDLKRLKYKEWLDLHNPITDITAYNKEYENAVEELIKNEDEKVKKAVLQNLLKLEKGAKDAKTWYILYKEGTITGYLKDAFEQALFNTEIKFRAVNRKLHPNDKYQKIMALPDNDPKKQLYLLLSETVSGLDKDLPRALRLNWRLPGIQKHGLEIRNSDGTISAVGDFASRQIMMYADDDVRGTFVDDGGKAVRTIPLFYRPSDKITADKLSYDLPTIFYRWLQTALEYQAKSQIEALVIKTQAILASRLTNVQKKNILTGEIGVLEHKSNLENQFNAWVDQVFYGNRLFDLGKILSKFSDKSFDVGKIVKSTIALASKNAMSLNWVAGLTNIGTGELNQIEEAFANLYGIDMKTLHKATVEFAKNCVSLIGDFYRTSPDSFLNKLANWFGVNEQDNNVTLSGALREGLDTYAYLPMRMGDIAMKYRFMMAMLMKMQAKDKDGKVIGRMYDFIKFDEDNLLTVDPKVANFNRDDLNKFSLKLRRLFISIHGNMSGERSLVAAERTWYGKAGLALRRFIEPNFERRFTHKHYDPFIEDERAGFARTGAKWVFVTNPVSGNVINFLAQHMFKCKKATVEIQRWKDMSESDKKDMIRFAIEIGICTIMYALSSILGSIADGDDPDETKDPWVKLLSYICYRIFTDFTFFYLPSSFVKILKDPFPVMSYFNRVSSMLLQLLDPFDEYKGGNHLFDNKLIDKFYRLIPGVKQINRFSNISSEMQYFIKGN